MKKKGLIISTVVMVVVLIASLTTATYAWFSAQSSATVDDLAITTKAADGLQIAMRNVGVTGEYEYVSGNLTYIQNPTTTNQNWEGDVNGWGTQLGFDGIDIGEITDAVTYWTSTSKYPVFSGYVAAESIAPNTTYYIPKTHNITSKEAFNDISGAKYYQPSADGPYVLASKYIDEVNTYYTITSTKTGATVPTYTANSWWTRSTSTADKVNEGIMNNGQFLTPTGYDDSINPIGYTGAVRNGNYYYLTMAIKPVTDIDKLGLKMTFGATQKGSQVTLGDSVTQGKLDGAMAAATRCNILFENTTLTTGNKATQQIAPFSAFYVDGTALKKYTSSTDTNFKTENDGAYNENGTYEFVISNSSVKAGSIYYITMEIWVEGTDAECIQETAGGGINLKMEFVYDKDSNKPVEGFTNGTVLAWN